MQYLADNGLFAKDEATLTVSGGSTYYIYSVRLLDGNGNVIQLDANGNAVLDLTNLRIGQTMKVGNRTSTLQEDVESIGTMQLAINGKLDATVSALDEGMVLTVASDGSIVPAFPSDTCAAMTLDEVNQATSEQQNN